MSHGTGGHAVKKWWWWWLPGWHKKWKLEKGRAEAVSSIVGDRLHVELMAQRPRKTDDVLNRTLLDQVLKRLSEIEEEAKYATEIGKLHDLIEDGELQGLFAAYLCPLIEIQDEGNLAIDLTEGWGVPKASIKKLHDLFGKKLDKALSNPEEARAALYAIFSEKDAWSDYTDEYESSMQRYTWWLFGATVLLLLASITALHFSFWFSPLLLLGLLFAGAAGSSVSVLGKMPALDVSLSGELNAYSRRVLTRIAVGVVASLIGCAFLAWGVFPISIQNQTFTDALKACTAYPARDDASLKALIVLGVAMLLGFSERTLTSFEQRVFGSTRKSQKG
jgi:hypothetical protein